MPNLKALDLSQILKVKPAKVIQYLVKPLGEQVEKGELLCLKKGLLGHKTEVFSPVEGTLERLEEETGRLVIREEKEEKKPNEILKDKKPTGRHLHKTFSAAFGLCEGIGELVVLEEPLSLKKLTPDLVNKVVVIPEIKSLGVIFKADIMEVAGLVVLSLKEEWRELLQEKKDFAMGLFLCKNNELSDFKKYAGKKAHCDGKNLQLSITAKSC